MKTPKHSWTDDQWRQYIGTAERGLSMARQNPAGMDVASWEREIDIREREWAEHRAMIVGAG